MKITKCYLCVHFECEQARCLAQRSILQFSMSDASQFSKWQAGHWSASRQSRVHFPVLWCWQRRWKGNGNSTGHVMDLRRTLCTAAWVKSEWHIHYSRQLPQNVALHCHAVNFLVIGLLSKAGMKRRDLPLGLHLFCITKYGRHVVI